MGTIMINIDQLCTIPVGCVLVLMSPSPWRIMALSFFFSPAQARERQDEVETRCRKHNETGESCSEGSLSASPTKPADLHGYPDTG